MTPNGVAALAQLHQLLVTMLCVMIAAGAGLLLISGAGRMLCAVTSRWSQRRQGSRADARLHAEAERGIADLQRYLARRDATP